MTVTRFFMLLYEHIAYRNSNAVAENIAPMAAITPQCSTNEE